MEDKLRQGEALFAKGKIEEAEKCFLSLLEEHPENEEVLNNLGVIHDTRGNVKEAERYFFKALEAKEDYPDALLNLADLYQNAKRWEEAALQLEKSIAIDDQDYNLFNQLGTVYLEMGDTEKARAVLEKSLELNSDQKIVKESLTFKEQIKKRKQITKFMHAKTTDEKLLDIFSDLDKTPDYPIEKIIKKIAIISTPRCGSSMFCNVLHRTQKFGYPTEYFNMSYINAYAIFFQKKNIHLDQYLDFIYRKTTSSNGIFTINFHVSQYIEMLKQNFNLMSLKFDRVCYLARKDKIEQAYSYAKAKLTGQWGVDTKPTQPLEGTIKREIILQALLHIVSSESYYENNLKPYVDKTYFYEDFSDLKNTTIFSEVLTDSNIIDFEPTWITSFKKQRNKQTLSEIAAFKEYIFPEWNRFCHVDKQ